MANNFTKNVISAINIKDVKYNIKAVPFHATEAEWNGMSYIPKQGEFIVYDVDSNNTSPRFKTGDGVTDVKNLPFTLATISEVQTYVNSQIGSAGHLKRVVLEDGAELPDVSEANIDTIYMKKNSGSRLVSDVFDEYMVINGNWEIIGSTRVDLSNYATQEMVDEKIETAISNIDFPEEIYKQNEAPTDAEEGALWLDLDEQAAVSGGGAGGSASIDVTAEVGQTIIVEEVDTNGKPTKWKAADFQEKICGAGMGYIYPERTITSEEFEQVVDFLLIEGNQYIVNFNGVDYNCEAKRFSTVEGTLCYLGNDLLVGGNDSGEPFVIGTTLFEGLQVGIFVPAYDESVESFTVSIKGEVATKIPAKFIPTLEEMRTVKTVVVPETTIPLYDGALQITDPPYKIKEGERYYITWNGEIYESVTKHFLSPDSDLKKIYAGNSSLAIGGADTGEPFAITLVNDYIFTIAAVDSTATSATIKIEREIIIPIPVQYVGNALPYYIDVDYEWNSSSYLFTCHDTAENVLSVFKSGRMVRIKATHIDSLSNTVYGDEVHFVDISSYHVADDGRWAFAFSWNDTMYTMMPQEDGSLTIAKFTD